MLAAAVAVSGINEKDALFLKCELLISINLQRNQKSIDGNMQALELTYEELKDVL